MYEECLRINYRLVKKKKFLSTDESIYLKMKIFINFIVISFKHLYI